MCRPTLLDPLQNVESASSRKSCRPAALAAAWKAAGRALSLHYSPPDQLACCLWQRGTQPPISYLIYRWTVFIVAVCIGVASFACQELPKTYHGPITELNYYKWFIYFTNWGFMLIIVQAGLAVFLVHKYRNVNSFIGKDIYIQKSSARTPLLGRLYWLTQVIATDLAFVITVIYWTMVHDPALHEVNALNLLVHVGNSVIMTCEICVTTHKARAGHAVHAATAGLTYGVFTAIYWALGGTDRVGERTIYRPLDWDKPASALCFVGVCAIAVMIAHALSILLGIGRSWLASRVFATRQNLSLPAH